MALPADVGCDSWTSRDSRALSRLIDCINSSGLRCRCQKFQVLVVSRWWLHSDFEWATNLHTTSNYIIPYKWPDQTQSDMKHCHPSPNTQIDHTRLIQWQHCAQHFDVQYARNARHLPSIARCQAICQHNGLRVSVMQCQRDGPAVAMGMADNGASGVMDNWTLRRL